MAWCGFGHRGAGEKGVMTAQRSRKGLSRQERRTLRRVILLFLALGLLWLLLAPGRGLLRYRNLQQRVRTLAEENQDLERRNAELQQEIERLRSDDAYLEELARKKYGLLRENESVYDFEPAKKKKKK
ncbi:MAG TPA: septum formation initiator family protein [Desulfobulbus sp.]|nr:septum formation initiator family protein [Desulfobulbus sp.]